MAFSTRPPARAKMLSLRLTNEQDAELEKIAVELVDDDRILEFK